MLGEAESSSKCCNIQTNCAESFKHVFFWQEVGQAPAETDEVIGYRGWDEYSHIGALIGLQNNLKLSDVSDVNKLIHIFTNNFYPK